MNSLQVGEGDRSCRGDAVLGLTKTGVSSRVYLLLSKCLQANEAVICLFPHVGNGHDLGGQGGSHPLFMHSASNSLSHVLASSELYRVSHQGALLLAGLSKCYCSADESNVENHLLKPFFKTCWCAYNQR